jgi:hypothetical protein
MQTIIIKNEQSKRYCEDIISEIPLDGSHTVIIKKTDRSTTARQRRLQWMWNEEVAKSGIGQDDDKESVHVRAKWMFARPILLRDDEVFQVLYETFIDTVKESLNYAEYCRVFAGQYISTERLSKAQRAEYLTEFQRYWTGHGVNLTDPVMQGVDFGRYQ